MLRNISSRTSSPITATLAHPSDAQASTTSTTSTTTTTSSSSASTKQDKYTQELEQFPASCHEDLRQAFPKHAQLKAFRKSLDDSEELITEASVESALRTTSDRRSSARNLLEKEAKIRLDAGKSSPKTEASLAKIVDQRCETMDKPSLKAEIPKIVERIIQGRVLAQLLCAQTPDLKSVTSHLHKEGHPEDIDAFTGSYIHTMDAESSGARRIMSVLQNSTATNAQKVFWMATILCHTSLNIHSNAELDMTLNNWRKLLVPQANTTDSTANVSAALAMAASLAVESGASRQICEVIFKRAGPVLSTDIDLSSAAEMILKTKRHDLFDLLPEEIQTRYKAASDKVQAQ